jgi:hypothetical protein
MTEKQKTKAVKNCKTFAELEAVIRENAPFISDSRDVTIEWNADELLRRIFIVIDGNDLRNLTRANGLRDKVSELCDRIFS